MSMISDVRKQATSEAFAELLARLESGQYPTITAKIFTKGEDPDFAVWIKSAVERSLAAPGRPTIHLVSGELCRAHWNKLGEKKDGQKSIIDILYESFDVYGICCTYIDHVPQSGLVGEINAIYKNFFQKAANEKKENIRLYCSDIREECHWICIGDEMHVVDYHEPCAGEADERETIILKGSGVAEFARNEFNLTLDRLAGYWVFGRNMNTLAQWLDSDSKTEDDSELDANDISAMLDVVMGKKPALSAAAQRKLPQSHYKFLFGGSAQHQVPYLLPEGPDGAGLFIFKRGDEINRMHKDGNNRLLPAKPRYTHV